MKVSINDNEYKMMRHLIKKYVQMEIDEIKLGDYLLKSNYANLVDTLIDDVRDCFISNIEGIIMCYKNGLLYEDKLARIVENKRRIRNESK